MTIMQNSGVKKTPQSLSSKLISASLLHFYSRYCISLTAHVADNLITELVFSISAQLQVTLKSLHVRLQFYHQRKVILGAILLILLVSVSSLPARITAAVHRLGVWSGYVFGFRHPRLIKFISGFTIRKSTSYTITSTPENKLEV